MHAVVFRASVTSLDAAVTVCRIHMVVDVLRGLIDRITIDASSCLKGCPSSLSPYSMHLPC